MMWFVFVPLWVVWVAIVFNVVMAIWHAVDDAICTREQRRARDHQRSGEEVLEQMFPGWNTPDSASLDVLLKRLAASRS